eukprot:m.610190 g.610190  ORF g.610190 m.610190 type:complete len:340 (-) comp22494_c0_seq9:5368-6387(-)
MNKRHSSVHVSIFGAIVTYVGVFVPTPPYVSNYPVKYDVSVFWDVPYFNVSAHEKHRLDIYRPITRVSVPLKDVIPKECSSEPDGCDSSYTMEQSADSAMNELRPVLLFVHGGGWKRGSRYNWLLGFHQNIGYAFASRGIMVVNVDYRKSIGPSALGGPVTLVVCALAAHAIRRLYPKSPVGRISFARLWIVLVGIVAAFAVFPMWTRWLRGDFALYPSHQDDITAAVDWVHNSIEEYGGDPTNIILMVCGTVALCTIKFRDGWMRETNCSGAHRGCPFPTARTTTTPCNSILFFHYADNSVGCNTTTQEVPKCWLCCCDIEMCKKVRYLSAAPLFCPR